MPNEDFYPLYNEDGSPADKARYPVLNLCIDFFVHGDLQSQHGIVGELKYKTKTSEIKHYCVFVRDAKGPRVYFFPQIWSWRVAKEPISGIEFLTA